MPDETHIIVDHDRQMAFVDSDARVSIVVSAAGNELRVDGVNHAVVCWSIENRAAETIIVDFEGVFR